MRYFELFVHVLIFRIILNNTAKVRNISQIKLSKNIFDCAKMLFYILIFSYFYAVIQNSLKIQI